MTTDRMALVDVSPEVLAALLQLPPGAEIVGVACPLERRGVMRLKLRGVGSPTALGNYIAVFPVVVRDGVVDWGLPVDDGAPIAASADFPAAARDSLSPPKE